MANKTCIIITMVLNLGISITVLTLGILIWKKKHRLELTQELQNNVRLHAIFDFSIVNEDEECPEGTNKISLGKYAGPYWGGEEVRTIYKWKGAKFCGATGEDKFNYIDLFQFAKRKCSETEEDCGQLDVEGQHLCVPMGFYCPLNYIGTTDQGRDLQGFPLKDEKNTYLYYSTEFGSEGKVITGFAVADKEPCLQPGALINIYGLDGYYTECPKFKGGSENKERYQKIDSADSFVNLLEENDLYTFNIPGGTNLYSSTFMGFDRDKKNSEENIEKNFFDKNTDKCKKGRKMAEVMWCLSLFSLVIDAAKSGMIIRNKTEEVNMVIMLVIILGFLVGASTFIFSVISFANFNHVIKIRKYVNGFYEAPFKEEYKNFTRSWKWSLACMILELAHVVILWLVCLATLAVSWIKGCLDKPEKASGEEKPINVRSSGELASSNGKVPTKQRSIQKENEMQELTNNDDKS
ncbi:MAG: hypothetical protein MJ252_30930 [archaeon]|nr:hypothetical protein [archaeon]